MRTAFDVASLYRSTVGSDRLFDMPDAAVRMEPMTNRPSHDVEKSGEDQYRNRPAVAGFRPAEIALVRHDSALVVTGRKRAEPEGTGFLHDGIATRAFRPTFGLARPRDSVRAWMPDTRAKAQHEPFEILHAPD